MVYYHKLLSAATDLGCELLTSFKLRNFTSFDLYYFTSLRIATIARRAFRNGECTKSYKGNAVSLLQRYNDCIRK